MTNKPEDDEKLDFETIRSKFLQNKPDSSQASNCAKVGLTQKQLNVPPPLLPKPVLINKRNALGSSGETGSSSTQSEAKRYDVKEAIRKFNNIGPRLFEPPNTAAIANGERLLPPTTSDACSSVGSDDAGEDISHNITSDSSACSTDTETVGESRTLQCSPDFVEGLSGNSSLVKDETLHKTIINEMRSNGLFKLSSDRVKNKNNDLPSDIGKMRETSCKINRQPCISEPPPSLDLEHHSMPHLNRNTSKASGTISGVARPEMFMRPQSLSFNARNTMSVDSSQSASTYSDYAERDAELYALYNTGDEKEYKRLRDLHSIAREFYNVQKAYVSLLNHIGEGYPKFLNEYSRRSGKSLLNTTNSPDRPHVITRISDHFKQILGVHRMFLDEFADKYKKWDSRDPDLASVLQQKAEFLKICNSFLKEKRQLCEEMQQALDENKDLALATKRFEDNVLNCDDPGEGSVTSLHGISIVMQLDSVHQNIVRYRLLMERYQKYLVADHPEARIAEEALRKLTIVSNTVNGFLAGADASKRLMPLYRKLAGAFDVFAPGRQLIHEGELQRQTRKELQSRYLILFSDMLLICRYASMGVDGFDVTRLYKIPIERVCVQAEDHEDYEREFVIISPKKSSAFVAKTKRDRDVWVTQIVEARRDYREKKRRRRLLASQKTISSQHNSCEESPDVEAKTFEHVSTQPIAASTSAEEFHAQRNSQRYEALWIPDNKATKCLMMGCDTKFNVLRRKHHCRQCGWLICRNCVGYAPVKIKRYERVKVCPECYYEIKKQFEEGKLFPPSRIQRVSVDSLLSNSLLVNNQIDIGEMASPGNIQPHSSKTTSIEPLGSKVPEVHDAESSGSAAGIGGTVLSINDTSLRVVYDGGLKYEIPKDLFQPPSNGPLRKTMLPVQKHSEMYLASGKLLLRNRKGVDVVRWGRLTKEMFLQFYEAEFDDQPLESYFVYGYSLKTTELESGSCVIELVHRNQFQTDRKDDRVIFQVAHAKSAERWLSSLRECIGTYSDENPTLD